MANNFIISNEAASAAMDAYTPKLNNGYLRIYSGSQPSTPDDAVGGGNTLLAELRFGTSAFGAASSGVAAANTITQNGTNLASGTAGWFRCLKSNGSSSIADGSVGETSADLILDSVSLVLGGTCTVSAMQLTQLKGPA